ncbi:hypothetical protein CsSME_00036031 [Camellia sinensis var. sinensis]
MREKTYRQERERERCLTDTTPPLSNNPTTPANTSTGEIEIKIEIERACGGNGGQAGVGGGRYGLERLVRVKMEKGFVGVGLQWEDEVDFAGVGSLEMLIADFGKGEGGERMGNEG